MFGPFLTHERRVKVDCRMDTTLAISSLWCRGGLIVLHTNTLEEWDVHVKYIVSNVTVASVC
jgi:hypothetical protein